MGGPTAECARSARCVTGRCPPAGCRRYGGRHRTERSAGVRRLGTQATVVQASVRGFPATAVMTTNLSRLTTDLGDLWFNADPAAVAAARSRLRHTWPPVAGIAVGAAAAAALWSAIGLEAFTLPAVLALVALLAAPVSSCRRTAGGSVATG
jgi:uncharacterized membrane protein YoaK (UPF0700 family)